MEGELWGGIVAVQSGAALIPAPSDLDVGPRIAAWAVILGAAQHLATRFVDARAVPDTLTGSP
jgi:hypothetical protein